MRGLQTWGLIAHTHEYDERLRPTNGRPRGGLSVVFMSGILKKNCLAQRSPDEVAERPMRNEI